MNMSSDDAEEDEQELREIQIIDGMKHDSQTLLYSEYSAGITPIQRSERELVRESKSREELELEYERLQQELIRLKQQQSMPASPSRSFPARNKQVPSLGVGQSKNLI